MQNLERRITALEMSSVYCGIRPPNMSDGEFVVYVMGMAETERTRFISAMSDDDLGASIAVLKNANPTTIQEHHAST